MHLPSKEASMNNSMKEEEFEQASQRFLDGKSTKADNEYLEKWADTTFNNSEDQREYNEVFADKSIEHRLRARLQKNVYGKKNSYMSLYRGLAAASIVLVLVCLALVFSRKQNDQQTKSLMAGIASKNTSSKSQILVLSDGSKVVLSKGSELVVDEDFGKTNRKVYLKGAAYFDVTRNENIPFFVKSGDLITEVLGTSFKIEPMDQEGKIKVSVKSGKVSVYTRSKDDKKNLLGVILQPNQNATFDMASMNIQKGIATNPRIIIKDLKKEDLLFSDQIIGDIIKILEKAYGIQMIIGNSNISKCHFSGDLNGLSMTQQLDLLTGTVNANYELRGVDIFILGEGCNENN
jgi:ferric-dicitrate binding protein FerR (iron transport regulator)